MSYIILFFDPTLRSKIDREQKPSSVVEKKNIASVWSHSYSFTREQRAERALDLDIGLDRRARELFNLCTPVSVNLKKHPIVKPVSVCVQKLDARTIDEMMHPKPNNSKSSKVKVQNKVSEVAHNDELNLRPISVCLEKLDAPKINELAYPKPKIKKRSGTNVQNRASERPSKDKAILCGDQPFVAIRRLSDVDVHHFTSAKHSSPVSLRKNVVADTNHGACNAVGQATRQFRLCPSVAVERLNDSMFRKYAKKYFNTKN